MAGSTTASRSVHVLGAVDQLSARWRQQLRGRHRRAAPEPVPGLPHSTPLPEQVLIGSRSVDGSSNLYQFDAATGALGKQLTTGSAGTQFAILSPDRGSVIYLQTGPTGSTLRTMAVDGTGDRELFTQLPSGCTSILRPAWNPIDQTTLALTCATAAGNTVLYQVVRRRIRSAVDRHRLSGCRRRHLLARTARRWPSGAPSRRASRARSSPCPPTRARRPSNWWTGHRAAATPIRRSPRTAARSPSGGSSNANGALDGADHRRQHRRLEPCPADRRDVGRSGSDLVTQRGADRLQEQPDATPRAPMTARSG